MIWRNYKSPEAVKPRTRNEKVLLTLLGVLLFFAGNFYGYRWYATKQSSLQKAYVELKGDNADAEIDLQKADLWKQRAEWVKAHEPVLTNEAETKAQVLEYALKGARDNKLEIMEQSLVPKTQHGPGGVQVGVNLKVKGPMENLIRFLTNVQKPAQFYSLSSFSLILDQDQSTFICSLQLVRYFREGS